MNYRHAYHAGNFADVVKHLALVAALLHLRKKDKPFAVIDSHGGCGLYDLAAEAARKTGEAEAGIERLRPLTGTAGLPAALARLSRSRRRRRAGALSRLAAPGRAAAARP